jgi:hypothetical protein
VGPVGTAFLGVLCDLSVRSSALSARSGCETTSR